MDRSTPIYLVSETYTEDAYGVLIPTPEKRLVYANVSSVSSAEFFEGGRNGLNPEYRMIMFAPDYDGEEIVEYNGVQYAVYRTYQGRSDTIELYVELRKGKQYWPLKSTLRALQTPSMATLQNTATMCATPSRPARRRSPRKSSRN